MRRLRKRGRSFGAESSSTPAADFFLNLTSPTNATIGDSQATGTITAQAADFTLNLTSPTNATIGDAQATGTITGSPSSLITPSATASRANGSGNLVAPLAVFFDASATTSSWTSRPFHDLEYRWDFGDEEVSTWAYGAQPGVLLKNVAFGPSAAHVYESAGTFTPKLYVRYRNSDGTYDNAPEYVLPTLTIISADTEWTGTKTICYSESGDFTGAPSGCVQVTVAGTTNDLVTQYNANEAANRRHLLRAGETFTTSSPIVIDVGGPSMFGSFGSGAKPIILGSTAPQSIFTLSSSSTPTGISDWRFQDLYLDSAHTGESRSFQGLGSCSDMLMHRVDMTRMSAGLSLSEFTLNGLNNSQGNYTHAMWDKFTIAECAITNLQPVSSGPNSVYVNCTRVAFLGNSVNNNANGEHGFRMQFTNRAVFSNNTIEGIATGKTNLTIRGGEFGGTSTLTPGQYTEKIVVSDNKFVGGASTGMLGCGPQGAVQDERGRNMIYERNLLIGSTSTTSPIIISQPDVTLRNNLIYIPALSTGGAAFATQPSGPLIPWPTRVHLYNNTVYCAGSAADNWRLFNVSANNEGPPGAVDQLMAGSVFECKNNILYFPNAVDTYVQVAQLTNGCLATLTQSNNTASTTNGTSDYRVNPGFANLPPTIPAHFVMSGGSYANGTGTNVSICADFYQTNTNTTPDMGAIVI